MAGAGLRASQLLHYSQRGRPVSEWGSQFLASDTWVNESRTSSERSVLPWLRDVQHLGTELIIIGASLQACQVCIDAWHVGFRPVLIIMEDQLGDSEAPVRQLAKALMQPLALGLFKHGPSIVFSNSSKCMLRLSTQGEVLETLVFSNIAGVNTHSECWQLFKGPALVVDLFPTGELTQRDIEDISKWKRRSEEAEREWDVLGDEAVPREEGTEKNAVRTTATGLGLRATRGVLSGELLSKEFDPGRWCEESGSVQSDHSHWRGPPPRRQRRDDEAKLAAAQAERREPSSAELFVTRSLKERPLVVQREFWEDRYDPDCCPFATVTYESMFPLCLAACLQAFLYNLQYLPWRDRSLFPWIRAWCRMLSEVCCFSSAMHHWLTALGLKLPTHRPAVLPMLLGCCIWGVGGVMGVFEVAGFYLSDFGCATLGVTLILPLGPLYVHLRGKQRLSKWNFYWFTCSVCGTFGYWLVASIVITSYLMLITINATAAAVFMTVVFTAAELAFVELMLVGYNRFVYLPRQDSAAGEHGAKSPNRCAGEQKQVLAWTIALVHGLTEAGRLVALICGSVRATSISHLSTVLVSAGTGLLINVPNRTLWTPCICTRLTGEGWAELFCPHFITAFHMDCKFAMGWPRFFCMAGVALIRGAIHGDWSTDWIPEESTAWCWNGIALVTCVIMFIAEVLEDWFVYTVNDKFPAPVWWYFGQHMLNQYDSDEYGEMFHMSHFYCPLECVPLDGIGKGCSAAAVASAPPDASKRQLRKRRSVDVSKFSMKKTVCSKGALSRRSSFMGTDLGPSLVCSPNFKQCARLTVFQLISVTTSCVGLCGLGFNVGLGLGNFMGYCTPMTLEGTTTLVLRSLFLIRHECMAPI